MHKSIMKRSVKTAVRYLYQHKDLQLQNFITNYEVSLKILNRRKSLKAYKVEIKKARAMYRNAKFRMLMECPYKQQSDIPLDDLNLSTRVKTVLRKEGITTIGCLENTYFPKLRSMPGIGDAAVKELYCLYDYFGLYLFFSPEESKLSLHLI